MDVLYRKKNFVVYRFDNEYIVHNTTKEFHKYHTHIKNYNTAKFIIDLAIKKSIPRDLNLYLLESVARITTDINYSSKIRDLIDVKKSKGKKYYYNVNKGIKSK